MIALIVKRERCVRSFDRIDRKEGTLFDRREGTLSTFVRSIVKRGTESADAGLVRVLIMLRRPINVRSCLVVVPKRANGSVKSAVFKSAEADFNTGSFCFILIQQVISIASR